MKSLQLASGWQFKQRTVAPLLDDLASNAGWYAATVPGSIHQDLLASELLPDPFYGLHEQEVQWVGEQDWLYRCRFSLPSDFFSASDQVELCFAGLDTIATVWLNGSQVLVSDNMFLPLRVAVSKLLRVGDQQNELCILFTSAWKQGKAREAQAGKVYPLWNGDSSRLYMRKAQYHYGWDWGPKLITAGVWRPVHLEAYTVRIAEVHCPAEVSADLQHAILPVRVVLEGNSETQTLDPALSLHLSLLAPDGSLVEEIHQPVSASPLLHTFELAQPQLWWPHGYGEQALYSLRVTLSREDTELDRLEQRLGLRRLQLVQRALQDAPGTSFFFEVNNTPIFCGGANWIPADSFAPRVTTERYRQWLELAQTANMQMLRVWGGGYYEDEVFYTLCDELGLLVWQDFMFGCGLYPTPAWMLESVRAEAIANVQRLRHHPSLVIWAGNNEDYMLAQSVGAYDPEYAGDLAASPFPAREIYERLLPEVCAAYDPTRPYWPSSPFGGVGTDMNDRTIGDQHIWNIWHGLVPYQDYPKFAGRFVSEFGMEGFPDLKTIRAFTPPEERYPQSRTLDFHNKSDGGPGRIAQYLANNFRIPGDLEGYTYITQLLQSEAMGVALRGWRRLWQGPGREYTAGALIWQLNDCWPVTSWALVDYYLRPKAAYYVVKRELASLTVGLARTDEKTLAVWAVNATTAPRELELELRSWTLDGELLAQERRVVTLLPDQATELGSYPCVQDAEQIVGARLLAADEVLARTSFWPEPLKYLALRDPGLELTPLNDERLQVQVQRPAKGVWLATQAEVIWSDNMLDLLPDDPQVLTVRGAGSASIEARWLNQ